MESTEQPNLKPLQLVLTAMAAGLVAITVVLVIVRRTADIAIEADSKNMLFAALGLVAVGDTVVFLLARVATLAIVRARLTRAGNEKPGSDVVWPGFWGLTIVVGGMLEGLGLLGAVVYLLTGAWIALLAPGVALFLIAVLIPTQDRFAGFVAKTTASIVR